MIFLILVLGFILRIINLNQSFWLDEAIGALAIKNYSFLGIFDFIKGDFHPPLYYLILKAWSLLFGYEEASLRMLSVGFGIGTILFLYLIARKLSPQKNFVPLFSAFLLATSPLHIYYSQEARMYVMAAFFATASIYFFLNVLEKEKNHLSWLMFSFSLTALVFTDYVPIFLLPALLISAFSRKMGRSWWLNFFLAHLPILLFGLLWLPIFAIQAGGGSWLQANLPAWKATVGGATLKQLVLVWTKFVLGRISLSNKLLYYGLVGIASIVPFYAGFLFFKSERRYRIVWLWLVVPLALAFLVSFMFPAFTYFRFIFVLPAFYLVISLGLAQIKTQEFKIILASFMILVNLVGWSIYVLDPNQQREMWRQAVSFIEGNAKVKDIVVFDYPEPFAPYRWYARNKVEAVGVADSISANSALTSKKTKEATKGKNGIYYFEYLVDLTDPGRIVEKTLGEERFKVSKIYGDFVGVGQIKYFVR